MNLLVLLEGTLYLCPCHELMDLSGDLPKFLKGWKTKWNSFLTLSLKTLVRAGDSGSGFSLLLTSPVPVSWDTGPREVTLMEALGATSEPAGAPRPLHPALRLSHQAAAGSVLPLCRDPRLRQASQPHPAQHHQLAHVMISLWGPVAPSPATRSSTQKNWDHPQHLEVKWHPEPAL